MTRFLWILILIAVVNFNHLFSQQVLTPRQIFDFNIGDAFHYHTSAYSTYSYQGGFSIQILGKLISTGNDTITYFTKRKSYIQNVSQFGGQVIDTTYSETLDTIVYTNLDTGIDSLPEYNMASYLTFQNLNTYYLTWNPACLDYVTQYDTSYVWTLGMSSAESYFNYLDDICTVYKNYSQGFGKGIGVISYHETVSGGPYYGNSYGMVYFKKDTVAAGNPDELLALNVLGNTEKLSLFPIPASNEIFLNSNSSYLDSPFEIYDEIGRIVFKGVISDVNQKCSITELNPGIFTIKVENAAPTLLKFYKL